MADFRPMLAAPAGDLARLRYPLLASPKLDGMRVCITERGPVTRSVRRLPNTKVATYLSHPKLLHLDGELIWGDPVADGVVHRSIAAGMAPNGPAPEQGLSFFVFDHFGEPRAPFTKRWAAAERAVKAAKLVRVHVVPQFEVRDAEALANAEATILEQGFEGVVLRRPDGPYRFGRVDAASQIMLKLKRRSLQVGTILQPIVKRGALSALLVQHADYADPFEVPLHGHAAALEEQQERLAGRRVRFSRHPGVWKGQPRSPLFEGLENITPASALRPHKEAPTMPRELIDTGSDKRYVRRTKSGRFKESDDVGKSLAADRRTKATTAAKKGEGDRGDAKPAKKVKRSKAAKR